MFEQSPHSRPDFATFVEAFRRHIEHLPGHSNAVFDASSQTIRYQQGGRNYSVNPNNFYIDYGKSDGDLGTFLQACSASLLSVQAPRPQSWAEAAPNLLPVVRDRRYLDMAILMAKVSATKAKVEIPGFPFRALAGELVVTLGLDTPTATSVVAATELESWGTSFDEAYKVALANLRARTQGSLNEVRPGLYLSDWRDGYDASRLLLPELLQNLTLRGDPVVSVPSRNLLVVAGSEDPAALAALAGVTADVLGEDSRPLSADVLQFGEQRWREAAASVSQQPRLLKARQLLLQRDYNQQAELLKQLNQAQGKDIFVASYKLAESAEDQPHRNITQVTEGVGLTLLPKADELAFLTRAQEFLLVPWTVAEEVLGSALKRIAIHPVRYRYQGFPDAAQLEKLRSQASISQAPPEPKQRMAAVAEDFRQAYQNRFQRLLTYDASGIRLIDQLIEDQRSHGIAATDSFVEGIGAFFGEVLVRQFDGEWILHKERLCVLVDDKNAVFPLERVARQWANGRAGGDSISGTYESVQRLKQMQQPESASAARAVQPSSAASATGPATQPPAVGHRYRIPAQPANPRMQQMLVQARDQFARLRTAAVAGTLDTMHAESPKWLTHRDPLIEVSRNQALLLREGRIVWAALVMANNLLFKPGKEDCPALLVYSLDPWFESRPDELHAIARRIFELKNTQPTNPDLRALARLVTEESDRGMGWRVPEALTDRDVRGSIFMVFRKHIPLGQMCGEFFPILVHPSTEAVMILPFEGWPAELIKAWKPGSSERSLAEVRALPEGLRLSHAPSVVAATRSPADGREFIWTFQTSVEAMDTELSIVEYGAFSQLRGKWGPANGGEAPFGPQQFAEGFGCSDGRLRPGQAFSHPKNSYRSSQLRSSRQLWYVIGKDAAGKLYRGEAEIELRGTLIAPDSEPLKPVKAGGLAAIGRLFGGSKALDLLRFDGVYRVKQQPEDDSNSAHCYLRLYPDKTAIYIDSDEQPSELSKWFNIQSPHVPTGYYSVKGDSIRIEIAAGHTSIVLSGTIDRNRLQLSFPRFANGPMRNDEFLFMGWRP
ncbi:MAG: DUF1444 family protein [Lysobacterales bacterium]